MNLPQFIAKYSAVKLTERSVAQQHFLDLCEILNHPRPAAADPTGDSFTFEKSVAKTSGGKGFADVWKRGFFGWEYKGKHKDLKAAYEQLLQYREALENPPLLVVCDIERIIVHTNFTNTPHKEHLLPLAELDKPESVEILRAVFTDPQRLKPGITRQVITQQAASRLAAIAQSLRDRSLEPHEVAHFLDRIIFCLFAEDIELLPKDLFSRIVANTRHDPARFTRQLRTLFEAMAHGGDFGADLIRQFNGNLFNDAPVLELTAKEIEDIREAAKLDWGAVDPSILGTLFERGLDPDKRSQLGAHYTSREDIELLVEPVVMLPLRREWETTRQSIEQTLLGGKRNARQDADRLLHGFLTRLGSVRVLDPACGSGNFLFVTLQKLKDLEKEVIDYSLTQDFSGFFPEVGPWQLYGIELNEYAADLAQMTVWIGYLQWLHDHGYLVTDTPILRSTDNIQCRDAILRLSDTGQPEEPEWPEVDFIVGNPPFLGDKMMRGGLGDEYVERLRKLYAGRLPGQSDLCCYWFEKTRALLAEGRCKRAGLLATQGIRGGMNRETLKRIKETGDIFFAVSDRNWILDGASVHVSMVGFDKGTEKDKYLDGSLVAKINSNLSAFADIGQAQRLAANYQVGFIGVAQKAPFDISDEEAQLMLHQPNPHGRPNSDVLRLICNASDITQKNRRAWNIDFGLNMPLNGAEFYETPFAHIQKVVYPLRIEHREMRQQRYWWLFARPCPDMREGLAGLPRYLATPRVSKYRLFAWLQPEILCDSAVTVFARADDYFFGVLHSRLHEVWARAQGTQLREIESGGRYTPTTCFETFPFPEPTPEQKEAISKAARELDTFRNNWLNPPEWTREETLEFLGTVDGPWARYVHNPDGRGIGTVRYPRLVPRDHDCAAKLATRTLTNLYNLRPGWLANAHRKLDTAVCAAYGWPDDITDEEILTRLLALNLDRSGTLPQPLTGE